MHAPIGELAHYFVLTFSSGDPYSIGEVNRLIVDKCAFKPKYKHPMRFCCNTIMVNQS